MLRPCALTRMCHLCALQREAKLISPGELLVVSCPQSHCTANLDPWTRGKSDAVIVRGEWATSVHERYLHGAGGSPSSGFIAMVVALAMARDMGGTLDVYGFGACKRCGKYNVRDEIIKLR